MHQQPIDHIPLKDEFSSDLSEIDLNDYADKQEDPQASQKVIGLKPKRKKIVKSYQWKHKWVIMVRGRYPRLISFRGHVRSGSKSGCVWSTSPLRRNFKNLSSSFLTKIRGPYSLLMPSFSNRWIRITDQYCQIFMQSQIIFCRLLFSYFNHSHLLLLCFFGLLLLLLLLFPLSFFTFYLRIFHLRFLLCSRRRLSRGLPISWLNILDFFLRNKVASIFLEESVDDRNWCYNDKLV